MRKKFGALEDEKKRHSPQMPDNLKALLPSYRYFNNLAAVSGIPEHRARMTGRAKEILLQVPPQHEQEFLRLAKMPSPAKHNRYARVQEA